MKRAIAFILLAAVMLMLAACGSKTEAVPTVAETAAAQETQAAVPETQPAAPEYAGVYCRTWNEEIGGTIVERNAYYILNEDHTGYLFMQAVGTLTWDENQMTDNLGLTYRIAVTQENGAVKLMVYEFQDTPTVYEKIDKLPAEMEAMIAEVQ